MPFGSTVYVGGGATTGGSADTSLLEGRIAALESQLAALTKRVGATEGVANKANDRALNALTQLGADFVRKDALTGLVNELIWNGGKVVDRIYAEAADAKTGLGGLIRSLVSASVGGNGIDQAARDIANEALKRATDAKTVAGQATAGVSDAVKAGIDTWLAESIAYTDKRLLNLMWDRGVKLARFLKVPGAATAPINDQKNIER